MSTVDYNRYCLLVCPTELLKGSDEPCALELKLLLLHAVVDFLTVFLYFIFIYSFHDYTMIKNSFHHVQLSTVSHIIITWIIMMVLAYFISVYVSIIIKDIISKGMNISQSKSICSIFLCRLSTAPYGDTNTINTCPCSLLIGSSWPGTTILIS